MMRGKRAMSEHAQGTHDAVLRYTMGKGDDEFTFNLVIILVPGKQDSTCVFDRYQAFATSLQCSDVDEAVRNIHEQYWKRWE